MLFGDEKSILKMLFRRSEVFLTNKMSHLTQNKFLVASNLFKVVLYQYQLNNNFKQALSL